MSVARTGLPLLFMSFIALGGNAVQAQTFTFDTSASPFVQGHSNQGFYADTVAHSPSNDSYAVGAIDISENYHSFFSFDLSSLNLAGKQISSATLTVTRFGFRSDQSRPSQSLGLFDVSASASTLKTTSGTNTTIFNDLGSGNSYGVFTVLNTATPATVTFILNSTAISDITAAGRAHSFFSIGGALTTAVADEAAGLSEGLFISSTGGNGTVQQLALTLVPAPEPSSLLVMSAGVLGAAMLAMSARRRMV